MEYHHRLLFILFHKITFSRALYAFFQNKGLNAN